jgi:predicted ATPase/DNA-binding SARP family transcriptional activator
MAADVTLGQSLEALREPGDPMPADRSQLELCIDLLGPLALRVEGKEVSVPGARRRALLAALALEAGRAVGADRLVDTLWPDEPPENALQALYNHVSRLRGHLGACAERLERHGGGYRLRLEPGELDVDAARRLAREAAEPGVEPARAVDLARAALALWRGPALEEFRGLPALDVESVALDELRRRLLDDLIEARLVLGDRSVTEDAASAAASEPLRERTALLHVRALAAEGRSAEALAAGQAFRRRLVEETGLDPGPALAELEQAVAAGNLGIAAPNRGTLAPPRTVARPDGPLVGRHHDREEVRRLLATNAIVTITGPGGVGKTRLALEVAADVSESDGSDVVVVDLAALDRQDRVCSAVASTLGLRTAGDVRPSDVGAGLAETRLLLVLDNCEHVVDACRDLVVTLRNQSPGVRVLATSRVVLHVPGEHVVRLQPLPVPRDAADLDALHRSAGVRAFLEHARRRNPGFDVIEKDAADLVEVLRRLDGLPLGIELAARQVALMPVSAVRDRLDRALDLTTGPMSDEGRQGTLRATIDSSYRLLTEAEQWLLRALAPFPGGVDLTTVEALAADGGTAQDPVDVLHRLVDASLVVADAATGRYRLLFTVRSFLLDQLEVRDETRAAEERFLARCLDMAAEIGFAVIGPGEPEADRRLRAELDNWRAARDVAAAHGRDDVRVGITVNLADAATHRDLRELWAWALELATDPALADHRARPVFLACAADGARLLGDLELATRLADEALALAGPDERVHHAWLARGSVAHFRGDFAAAREAWLQSGSGRRVESGVFLASAALAAAYGGDREEARELLDRAHAGIARSRCVSHAAFAAYVEGELRVTDQPEESIPWYLEAVELARRCGATFVEGVGSVGLASAQTRTGDIAGAAEGFGYLLDSWARTGHRTQLWTTARNAAALLSAAGRWRAAGLLLIRADQEPGAAVVNPSIARHSGRAFVPLQDVVPEEHIVELRAEAARLSAGDVLDLAREELADLTER